MGVDAHLVDLFVDHGDELPGQGQAEDDRPSAGEAPLLAERVVQDVLHVVLAQPVLGDVLHVAFGIVVQIPDAFDVGLRDPRSPVCCIILPHRPSRSTVFPGEGDGLGPVPFGVNLRHVRLAVAEDHLGRLEPGLRNGRRTS